MLFRRAPQVPAENGVRLATRRDVPQLVDLWLKLMETHAHIDDRFAVRPDAGAQMARRFQSLIPEPDARILVAEAQDRVVGFAAGHIDLNLPFLPGRTFGFISDLFVLEEFRREGRATSLVETLRRWFQQRQVTSIQLHAAAQNPAARAFWARMGFEDYLIRMWSDV